MLGSCNWNLAGDVHGFGCCRLGITEINWRFLVSEICIGGVSTEILVSWNWSVAIFGQMALRSAIVTDPVTEMWNVRWLEYGLHRVYIVNWLRESLRLDC